MKGCTLTAVAVFGGWALALADKSIAVAFVLVVGIIGSIVMWVELS